MYTYHWTLKSYVKNQFRCENIFLRDIFISYPLLFHLVMVI